MPERLIAPILAVVPGSTIVAALLGLSWASARAADVGEVAGGLPVGLDSLTLPAALVIAAGLIRGTAISVTIRHVHALSDDDRRALERAGEEGCKALVRAARHAAGGEVTEER
jgi:hypothetical protein